ncbi:Cyclin-like protein [Pseudocohnilembus persalinus]|uniref:Cyclin-like protein n=1 Tax=Pseudocohnilembus persalinus TaxID=266149 RepID=A0A0V0QKB3_PSEPJ|nr:Cyclin-like protein [Pseudocohnilembus persalinus]|eukprot:KRX02745.1 Cyclin-like protein [Pseudocohnilembus persalinus]
MDTNSKIFSQSQLKQILKNKYSNLTNASEETNATLQSNEKENDNYIAKKQLQNLINQKLHCEKTYFVELAQEITNYIFEKEKQSEISFKECPFEKHKNLSEEVRKVLINWIIQQQNTFEFPNQILYDTIKYIDYYLIQVEEPDITLENFQELGITAFQLAVKNITKCSFEMEQLEHLTKDWVKKDKILQREFQILETIGSNFTAPTRIEFLEIFCSLLDIDEKTKKFAAYILDSTLYLTKFIKYKCSFTASLSIFLAYSLINEKWGTPKYFQIVTNYSEKEIIQYKKVIMDSLLRPVKYPTNSKNQNIYKYLNQKYKKDNILEQTQQLLQKFLE